MTFYVPKFSGYIADTFALNYIRCDGTPFFFNEASATSVTDTVNSITVTGGWSRYPLAFIDTDRSFEMAFTSSQFTMDMFEMANTATAKDEDYDVYETDLFDVVAQTEPAALTITLPFQIDPTSVKIRGMEVTSGEVSAGKFKASYDAVKKESTLTFFTGDVVAGDSIFVTYKRKIASAHIVTVTTDTMSSRGELTASVPVYSSGTDCTESGRKGMVHIYVPRVRVTSMPGLTDKSSPLMQRCILIFP